MDLIQKIASLGLKLPAITTPGGNYVSVHCRGKNAYVAIQFPILDGTYWYQGAFGREFSTEAGYKAAQLCALNVLAQLHAKVGFEYIAGMNHMDAYYRSYGDWDESPKVINGASDLFVNVLGEKGIHTRSIVGVDNLPRDFSVGITCSFSIY